MAAIVNMVIKELFNTVICMGLIIKMSHLYFFFLNFYEA